PEPEAGAEEAEVDEEPQEQVSAGAALSQAATFSEPEADDEPEAEAEPEEDNEPEEKPKPTSSGEAHTPKTDVDINESGSLFDL
ncbi:MAG: hypothetical protein QOD98_2912, partial [Nocardioidaceae bacterium]|nr:hypothetical protein [Nocardioidaceae bacterium]